MSSLVSCLSRLEEVCSRLEQIVGEGDSHSVRRNEGTFTPAVNSNEDTFTPAVNSVEADEITSKTEITEQNHPVGYLMTPKDIDKLEVFKFSTNLFKSPLTIDNTDWNLRPKDQGKKPYCAGYAAAAYIENLLWRKTGVPDEVDGETLYKIAKNIDGCPDGQGTTLIAALQAGLEMGYFEKERCKIKVLRTIDDVKRCIHRYGACLVGVTVTREYYACNKNKTSVCGEGDQSVLGGHALLAVGFRPSGLIVRNSWGRTYGSDGDIIIAWKQLEKQFLHGATYDNPLAEYHI